MKEQIDDIFRETLGDVQVTPSSSVKTGVVKAAKQLFFQKVLVSTLIIGTSATAIGLGLYMILGTENMAQTETNNSEQLIAESSAVHFIADTDNSESETSLVDCVDDWENDVTLSSDTALEDYHDSKDMLASIGISVNSSAVQNRSVIPTNSSAYGNSSARENNSAITSSILASTRALEINKSNTSLNQVENFALASNQEVSGSSEVTDDNLSSDMMETYANLDTEVIETAEDLGLASKELADSSENLGASAGENIDESESFNEGNSFKTSSSETTVENVRLFNLQPLTFNSLTKLPSTDLLNFDPAKADAYNRRKWGVKSYVSFADFSANQGNTSESQLSIENQAFSSRQMGFGLAAERSVNRFNFSLGLGFLSAAQELKGVLHTTELVQTEETQNIYETVIIDGNPTEVLMGTETVIVENEVPIQENVALTNQLNYIQIPALVGYDLYQASTLQFGLNAGVGFNILANANGELYNSESVLMNLSEDRSAVNRMMTSYQLGIYVNKHLSEKLSLFINPQMRWNSTQQFNSTLNQSSNYSGLETTFGLKLRL